MRNEWYGDKRDFLKWPTLLYLAKREGIRRIFHVAMRTDTKPTCPVITCLNGARVNCEDITVQVADHFHQHNDLNGIKAVGKHFGVDIVVRSEAFTHANRGGYFAKILAEIQKHQCPTVWFFDPDTGIEPQKSRANHKHVKLAELSNAFQRIPGGDYLACYQHAPRGKKQGWQKQPRLRLSQQLGVDETEVEVFVTDYAKDVIILAVRK